MSSQRYIRHKQAQVNVNFGPTETQHLYIKGIARYIGSRGACNQSLRKTKLGLCAADRHVEMELLVYQKVFLSDRSGNPTYT